MVEANSVDELEKKLLDSTEGLSKDLKNKLAEVINSLGSAITSLFNIAGNIAGDKPEVIHVIARLLIGLIGAVIFILTLPVAVGYYIYHGVPNPTQPANPNVA